MSLAQSAQAVNGKMIGANVEFGSVTTDTRKAGEGDLFVALVGPHFDGHDFISQAKQAGVVAALVSRKVDAELPYVIVDDTRIGLGKLAAFWRAQFEYPLVAVTGSNGKTTVKEMLASIFAQQGKPLSTEGNLNNDIGVPLTLFRLDSTHTAAIIEMGANHPGEIEYLSMLTQPTIALVNNAGEAHLEGFGSLEGVAEAKGEIYSGLSSHGVAVINVDDPYTYVWQELCEGKEYITFGLEKDADVMADYKMTYIGLEACIRANKKSVEVLLPLMGRHNVMNALAATAVAVAAGIEFDVIVTGLQNMQPVSGRLELKQGLADSRIIDDTYNANPASLRAGLSVLADFPGRHYLALGDMAELGDDAAQIHQQAGIEAKLQGVDKLYAVGELAKMAARGFAEGAIWFARQEEMIDALRQDLHEDVTLLIKGSRRMHMERVVEALSTGKGA